LDADSGKLECAICIARQKLIYLEGQVLAITRVPVMARFEISALL